MFTRKPLRIIIGVKLSLICEQDNISNESTKSIPWKKFYNTETLYLRYDGNIRRIQKLVLQFKSKKIWRYTFNIWPNSGRTRITNNDILFTVNILQGAKIPKLLINEDLKPTSYEKWDNMHQYRVENCVII